MDGNARDPDSGKRRAGFVPDVLDSSVIAFPLMERLKNEPDRLHHVVIDLNLNYPGGREEARARVEELFEQAQEKPSSGAKPSPGGKLRGDAGSQYVFGELPPETIKAIVRIDRETSGDSPTARAIFHVWPDFEIRALG
jgi:serine protease AprX